MSGCVSPQGRQEARDRPLSRHTLSGHDVARLAVREPHLALAAASHRLAVHGLEQRPIGGLGRSAAAVGLAKPRHHHPVRARAGRMRAALRDAQGKAAQPRCLVRADVVRSRSANGPGRRLAGIPTRRLPAARAGSAKRCPYPVPRGRPSMHSPVPRGIERAAYPGARGCSRCASAVAYPAPRGLSRGASLIGAALAGPVHVPATPRGGGHSKSGASEELTGRFPPFATPRFAQGGL